jgi:chromosome segregation ATPase
MTQAQASVKSLDAALKLNEKQFKATGDAENYMAQKTTLLQQKLEAQRKAAKNAEDALQTMRKNGVDEASAAYQNMQKKLLDARAAILDTEGDINQLGQKTEETASKADKLGNSLSGLNKKVSLQQVQSAIDTMMFRCTVIMVAHRLSTVRDCDRIILVKDGKIAEQGTFDELMEMRGGFYELMRRQSGTH